MKGYIPTSDDDINAFISCPKTFHSAPQKAISVNQNFSQTFTVYNKDLKFSVFISCSKRMIQDFSLGLMYEGLLLLRCNGFHGTTKAGFFSAKHHAYPHAHLLTMEDIQNGRGRKPSKIEDLTGKYVNISTATAYFFERCTILGYEQYFNVNQYSLFD